MFDKLFSLSIFDDGGATAAAGASESAPGDSTSAAAGQNTDENAENGQPIIRYGKPTPDAGISESDQTTDTTNNNPEERPEKPDFDELIKGKYKDAFQKKVNSIVNQRFKAVKGTEKALDDANAVLDQLRRNVGVMTNEELLSRIGKDNELFRSAALDHNMDEDTYRSFVDLKISEQRATAELEELKNREAFEKEMNGWSKQADKLRETYPDLDLISELNNSETGETLYTLLKAGIPLDIAYHSVHPGMMREAVSYAEQKGFSEGEKKAAANIQKRQSRPSENGTGNQTGTVWKSDPSKYTVDDFEEIEKRVMRGEKVYF